MSLIMLSKFRTLLSLMALLRAFLALLCSAKRYFASGLSLALWALRLSRTLLIRAIFFVHQYAGLLLFPDLLRDIDCSHAFRRTRMMCPLSFHRLSCGTSFISSARIFSSCHHYDNEQNLVQDCIFLRGGFLRVFPIFGATCVSY